MYIYICTYVCAEIMYLKEYLATVLESAISVTGSKYSLSGSLPNSIAIMLSLGELSFILKRQVVISACDKLLS